MKVTLSNPVQISEGTLLFRIVDRQGQKGLPSYRQQLRAVQPRDTVVLTNESVKRDSRSVASIVEGIEALGAQPVLLTQACDCSEQNRPMQDVRSRHGLPGIAVGSAARDVAEVIRGFRF